MNILILCAGYGTRLRPLTDQVPKPLIPLLGRPLIEHQIDGLRDVEYKTLCINAHHLCAQIEAWAAKGLVDRVFPETKILGTGGPLRRLWQEGLHDDALILNGDLVHDVDLPGFVRRAEQSGAEFAFLCVDRPEVNTLMIDPQNQVLGVKGLYGRESARRATYGGIAWYSAAALSKIQAAHSDVRMFWREQAAKGSYPAAIEAASNAFWCDVGTPAGLHRAAFGLHARMSMPDSPCRLPGVVLDRCICGRNLQIAAGAKLRNCLLLDQARLPVPETISSAVIGKDFVWTL